MNTRQRYDVYRSVCGLRDFVNSFDLETDAESEANRVANAGWRAWVLDTNTGLCVFANESRPVHPVRQPA
jgi:hypothetical protein